MEENIENGIEVELFDARVSAPPLIPVMVTTAVLAPTLPVIPGRLTVAYAYVARLPVQLIGG